MAAPKGNKFAKGRPKGVPNAVTTDTRIAFRNFVEGRIGLLDEWMDKVAAKDPDKALDFMLKFSEYFIPKLARTELANEDGKEFIVKITNYAGSAKFYSETIPTSTDGRD